jgi:hypothetical protein
VRIFVTLLTAFVRDLAVEVATLVTVRASQFCVLADQLELRLVVVEGAAGPRLLPAVRIVAAFAAAAKLRFLKCAAVRIGVAILTGRERDAFKLQRARSSRIVAFVTRHLLMLPRQHKLRL